MYASYEERSTSLTKVSYSLLTLDFGDLWYLTVWSLDPQSVQDNEGFIALTAFKIKGWDRSSWRFITSINWSTTFALRLWFAIMFRMSLLFASRHSSLKAPKDCWLFLSISSTECWSEPWRVSQRGAQGKLLAIFMVVARQRELRAVVSTLWCTDDITRRTALSCLCRRWMSSLCCGEERSLITAVVSVLKNLRPALPVVEVPVLPSEAHLSKTNPVLCWMAFWHSSVALQIL